ncbi:hypothetical protein QQZ08_012265 [Neonectria magnoliae]|uniref:Uncharacterized protein n=1 Tax=Neonectria magnoliae TaxID=2732573 RepID=A0ABR1H3M0_9HYPO
MPRAIKMSEDKPRRRSTRPNLGVTPEFLRENYDLSVQRQYRKAAEGEKSGDADDKAKSENADNDTDNKEQEETGNALAEKSPTGGKPADKTTPTRRSPLANETGPLTEGPKPFKAPKPKRKKTTIKDLADPVITCRICDREAANVRDLKYARWLCWRICATCFHKYGKSRASLSGEGLDRKVMARANEIKEKKRMEKSSNVNNLGDEDEDEDEDMEGPLPDAPNQRQPDPNVGFRIPPLSHPLDYSVLGKYAPDMAFPIVQIPQLPVVPNVLNVLNTPVADLNAAPNAAPKMPIAVGPNGQPFNEYVQALERNPNKDVEDDLRIHQQQVADLLVSPDIAKTMTLGEFATDEKESEQNLDRMDMDETELNLFDGLIDFDKCCSSEEFYRGSPSS